MNQMKETTSSVREREMKLNLDYSNNTVRIGVELFDDGTKYEQGYSIKAGKDIHIDFATDFMADLYGREDMYAKTVEIATKMEENINTLVHHLAEMQAEEKHIKYALSQE